MTSLRRHYAVVALALLLSAAGCSDRDVAAGSTDAGDRDASDGLDASSADASSADASPPDASGASDGSAADSGGDGDGGATDAGEVMDGGAMDAATTPDGGAADAGAEDGGEPDACVVPPTCPPPPTGCSYVGATACSCGTLTCGSDCGGVTCSSTQWCDYDADGACAGAGTCRERPGFCPSVYDPVCGCDGATHGNACEAAAAGTDVARTGAC